MAHLETQAITGLALAAVTEYLNGVEEAYQLVVHSIEDRGTPDERAEIWFAGVLSSGYTVAFRRTQRPGQFPVWHIGDPSRTDVPVEDDGIVYYLELATGIALDIA